MKKNIFPRFFRGDIGGGTLYLVAVMIGLVGFATVMTRGVTPPTVQPAGNAVTPVLPTLDAGKKNLQLYTFGYTTPAPTPTTPPPTQPPQPTLPPRGSCPLDGAKTPGCGECTDQSTAACDEDPCNNPGFQGMLI